MKQRTKFIVEKIRLCLFRTLSHFTHRERERERIITDWNFHQIRLGLLLRSLMIAVNLTFFFLSIISLLVFIFFFKSKSDRKDRNVAKLNQVFRMQQSDIKESYFIYHWFSICFWIDSMLHNTSHIDWIEFVCSKAMLEAILIRLILVCIFSFYYYYYYYGY